MIALAFLWHQHQPYYPDDVAGENWMPWVRLHGVKDYYGMARHLLEVPELHCTINLVPSLLLQLQAYTERGASDRFLDVSRVPADGLSEGDALFLLDHFFMASAEQMILPNPRYAELYQRRGAGKNTAREALRRFTERDLRDLQVWFNLAWVHPLAVEGDDCLGGLRDKGRHFSEADKEALLAKHLEILRQVVPLHRQLAGRGQVELTTTPFYHPILPLLLDKKLAREAMPQAKLPRYTAGYPEDAELHVRRALEMHARTFGQPPRGMWPAEGSVCQTMLPLLARHGIRWIATDEEVLSASTNGLVSRDGQGHVRNPERMYRPYKVREGASELSVVFRDHALSDLIGFHYQRGDPIKAADNFVGCLLGIDRALDSPNPGLVSVVLDGENCWEHYPGGGVAFLRALYERCTRTPDVRPLRVGEYLERYPPQDTLPHLFAGSWINHNFAIWIGHEEDNTAWDALHQAREYLVRRGQEIPPARSASAGTEARSASAGTEARSASAGTEARSASAGTEARSASAGTEARSASAGTEARSASAGTEARSASAGTEARSASAGTEARSASAGTEARSASAGTEARSASAGTEARSASAGTEARSASAGTEARSASAGTEARSASAGTEARSASAGTEARSASAGTEARSASEGPLAGASGGWGPLTPVERAWEEIYIAEGSDWFWWFGDDHSSAQDALFDYLFRKHLQNVYRLLGDEPPAELNRPISRRAPRVHHTLPRALLEVKIDGRYTFFEWLSAGHYTCHNERGTMALATQGPLRDLYFGFDLDDLLVRVDCEGKALTALAPFDTWRVGFVEPAGYEVRVCEPGRPGQTGQLLRDGEPVPPPAGGSRLQVAVERIAEVAIPFDELGVAVDRPVQFYVELLSGGQSRDRAPRQGAITLHRPSPDYARIMWDV